MERPPLFSVVIPTRERHDTLRQTLKTVFAQTEPNFEVVVHDNASSEATAEVVREFPPERLTYARSATPLAMSDNWERAIELARGDYVFVLGDDDGLLPDAIEWANRLHVLFPGQVLAWKPVQWVWPDCVVKEFRNVLHMHLSARCEVRSTADVLRGAYSFEVAPAELPQIYNAFIPHATIERVRERCGTYFPASPPDVASGLLNLAFEDHYVHCFRPLSVWGASRFSLGVAAFMQHLPETGERLAELESAGFGGDPEEFLSRSKLAESLVAGVLLAIKRLALADDPRIELDWSAFVRNLTTAGWRYPAGPAYEHFVAELRAIADHARIPATEYELPPPGPGPQRLINNYRFEAEHNLVCFDFETDPERYPTIAETVRLVVSMSMPVQTLEVVDAAG